MTFNSHPFKEQFHIEGGTRRFANLWFPTSRVSRTQVSAQGIIRNMGDDTAVIQLQTASREELLTAGSFTDLGTPISISPGGTNNFDVDETGINILSFVVSSSMGASDSTNILITGMTNTEAVFVMESEEDWYRENVSGTSVYEIDFTTPSPLESAASQELELNSGTGDTTIPASAIQVGYAAAGGAITVNGANVPSGISSTLYGPFSDDIDIVGSSAVWEYTIRA